MLRHRRTELVRRSPRNPPHRSLGSVGITDGPAAARAERVPRRHVVGVAGRAVGRDVRVHHHGHLHDQRHVHAALPRGAAEHRRRDRARPRMMDGAERLAAVLAHHASPAEADALHRADAGPDRLLAGVRPDLRRHQGGPAKTTLTPAYLVYQRRSTTRTGAGCGDRVHPVPDHHRFTLFQRWVLRERPVSKRRAIQRDGTRREPSADRARPRGGIDTQDHTTCETAVPADRRRGRRARRNPRPAGTPSPDARSRHRRRSSLYAMLIVLALIYIYPFLVQVSTSFKSDAEATADPDLADPADLVPSRRTNCSSRAATSRCGS